MLGHSMGTLHLYELTREVQKLLGEFETCSQENSGYYDMCMFPSLATRSSSARCRSSDIGIVISNVGVGMLGIQKLSIFPGKGGCSNNWMVRIIRVITVHLSNEIILRGLVEMWQLWRLAYL